MTSPFLIASLLEFAASGKKCTTTECVRRRPSVGQPGASGTLPRRTEVEGALVHRARRLEGGDFLGAVGRHRTIRVGEAEESVADDLGALLAHSLHVIITR